ncbi:MAG: Uma2 family endonuclease [Gemmataceae bacterium]
MTPQVSPTKARIRYPESDGKPMGENTLQFQWIVTIEGNLEALFRDDPNVFVAGDLFWYPVEGRPDICTAPDVLVVFGRPKGHRGSYQQWEEAGVAPQVVFEVLSPSNRGGELIRKFRFYQQYGVQEYYIYDPDTGELTGWQRSGDELVEIPQMNGWVSPRLGIRFDTSGPELVIYRPDGQRFRTFNEISQLAEEAQRRAEQLAERLRSLGIDPDEVTGSS